MNDWYSWLLVGLMIIIVVAFFAISEWSFNHLDKFLKKGPGRDPYLSSVRAVRATAGKNVAVSIQDPETKEFFYYPSGSETRLIKDKKNTLHLDCQRRDK